MHFLKTLARASLLASDLEDAIAVDCADGRRVTLRFDGEMYAFDGAARVPVPRASGRYGRMYGLLEDLPGRRACLLNKKFL